jgi:PAS domain S-box-containing protein
MNQLNSFNWQENRNKLGRDVAKRATPAKLPVPSPLLNLGRQSYLIELFPMAAYAVRAPDGVIAWYNSRAAELWGRAPVIGDTDERFCGAHTLYHADGTYMAHCDTPVSLALITGASVHEEEVVIARPDGSRVTVWVHIDPIRDNDGKIVGAVNFFHDITERKQRETELQRLYQEAESHAASLREAQEQLELKVEQRTVSLRSLSSQLMHLQDDERRRISRDLHDSVGQHLSLAKMSLHAFARSLPVGDDVSQRLFLETEEDIDTTIREIRTVSYLLHPPLLDEVGLLAAVRWYTDGFMKRSGIFLDVEIPAELPRLTSDKETALFRIVQESLTNIHRHSEASNAFVKITVHENVLRLEVCDDGKGMANPDLRSLEDRPIQLGVGIPGMRQRLRDLDGNLTITSAENGTRLIATLPITSSFGATAS